MGQCPGRFARQNDTGRHAPPLAGGNCYQREGDGYLVVTLAKLMPFGKRRGATARPLPRSTIPPREEKGEVNGCPMDESLSWFPGFLIASPSLSRFRPKGSRLRDIPCKRKLSCSSSISVVHAGRLHSTRRT